MILIIGGSGFLGYFLHHALTKCGKETHSTFNTNIIKEKNFHLLNLENKDDVIKIIHETRPDTIIYAAGLTNVDLCEEDNKLARAINVNGIKNVIEGARKRDSKIIYISTSVVFSGKKNEYFEDDDPDPISFYGKTKLEGEIIVMNSGLRNLIIRTDQPYGWKKKWHHTNSVLRVSDYLKRDEILKEISDWYNTPTFVDDFITATTKLIDKQETGIFHVVGSDFLNRYDSAILTAEVFKLNNKLLKQINSSELKLPAKRSNVNLSTKKLFQKTGIRMSRFKNGLTQMLEDKKIWE